MPISKETDTEETKEKTRFNHSPRCPALKPPTGHSAKKHFSILFPHLNQ